MGNLPYAQNTTTLEKMLNKIQTASVPDKFSQDFVSAKLGMKGGTPRSTIPFIKKMGFVTSDGTPTNRYSEFRNKEKSGTAIADSLKELYEILFDMDECVYELEAESLKSLIVQATGAEPNSTTVAKTLATFMTLNKIANFSPVITTDEISSDTEPKIIPSIPEIQKNQPRTNEGINLSYTINLNLPPTSDIAVFNAIFKSLKQHLLQE